MKPFTKKVLFLFFLMFTFQLVISCSKSAQLSDLYDFSEMKITFQPTKIGLNDLFLIELEATDLEFIGWNTTNWGFNSTLAYYFCDNSSKMKSPFTEFNITSTAEFDATHQTGDDLTKFFLVKSIQEGNNYTDADDLSEEFPDGYDGSSLSFRIKKTPSRAKTHQFTLALTRSNGDIITVETSPITWE